MPSNLIRNEREERLWREAKEHAEAEGHKGDWAYVVSIYERMLKGAKTQSAPSPWAPAAGNAVAVTAPARTENAVDLFLGGSCTQNKWRSSLIVSLSALPLVIANPERDNFPGEDIESPAYLEQVLWEREYLARARVVAFWLDSEKPTSYASRVEIGAAIARGQQIILGMSEDFPGWQYIEVYSGQRAIHDFPAFLAAVREAVYVPSMQDVVRSIVGDEMAARLLEETPPEDGILHRAIADSPVVPAATVYDYLKRNYPERTLSWVIGATWRLARNVPLELVRMSRRPGGRDPKKVEAIEQAIRDGEPMEPIVLVEARDGFEIADGYHRTLAYQHIGRKTIRAYVASGTGEDGPWRAEMHREKRNMSAYEISASLLSEIEEGPR